MDKKKQPFGIGADELCKVVRLLINYSPISRREIAANARISFAKASKIICLLEDLEIAESNGTRRTHGRPERLFSPTDRLGLAVIELGELECASYATDLKGETVSKIPYGIDMGISPEQNVRRLARELTLRKDKPDMLLAVAVIPKNPCVLGTARNVLSLPDGVCGGIFSSFDKKAQRSLRAMLAKSVCEHIFEEAQKTNITPLPKAFLCEN